MLRKGQPTKTPPNDDAEILAETAARKKAAIENRKRMQEAEAKAEAEHEAKFKQ